MKKLTSTQEEYNERMMKQANCEHQFEDLYSEDKMTVVKCLKCDSKKTILKKDKKS